LWLTASGAGRVAPPPAGRVMIVPERDVPAGYYEAVGYRALGGRLVRLDMLERFAAAARALGRGGPFTAQPKLGALRGATAAETGAILEALGYRATPGEAGVTYSAQPRTRRGPRRGARPSDSDSPFAALRRMQPAE
jgi:ATP-dependent RNA helicase SUPV3L1/SUV3